MSQLSIVAFWLHALCGLAKIHLRARCWPRYDSVSISRIARNKPMTIRNPMLHTSRKAPACGVSCMRFVIEGLRSLDRLAAGDTR